jgi:adenylate cyclase
MERLKRIARRLLIPASIAVLSTTIAVLMTHNVAFLTQAERFVEDLRIATLLPPEPQDADIVIAAVNEDTLKLFPYRSPVDRAFLANVLKALDAKEPRAIAMDVLLDQATEPAKDELLRATIASLKTPLVISYTSNPEIVDKKQLAFLDSFVPPEDRVAAEIASDTFGTARWILPYVVQPDGSHMPAFARGVLAKVGIETPDTQPEMAWHGRPNPDTTPFKMFPANLVPMLPKDWIKGKFVLLGEVVSLTDRHRTPFAAVYSGSDGSLPGIEVHANAVAQLLEHKPPRTLGEASEIALVFFMAVLGAGLGALPVPVYQRIALGFASFALLWVSGFAVFRLTGVSIVLISPSIAGGLAQWGTDLVTGRQMRRQREFIQNAFGRFVSPAVVAKLVADPGKLALEGEAREMTFIFTDIEGFTTLSEELAQREKQEGGTHILAPMLNAYLDGICAAILRHEGTIDKFIGDAVMVIFNAPADQPDHAERAVHCALSIDAYSEEFRVKQHEKGIKLGKTRIGIHTGPAIVGNFGAHNKMQYTALGDTVNTASRLEGVNKYFGTRICVSETTRTHVTDVVFRPIGEIAVKGKAEMFEIFEPLEEARANSSYTMRYLEAYQLAKEGEPAALKVFEELMAEAPDDKCVALLYEQMRESNVVGVGMVMHDK